MTTGGRMLDVPGDGRLDQFEGDHAVLVREATPKDPDPELIEFSEYRALMFDELAGGPVGVETGNLQGLPAFRESVMGVVEEPGGPDRVPQDHDRRPMGPAGHGSGRGSNIFSEIPEASS